MAELPLLDDAWVLARRGPRHAVDPARPYAYLIEPERMRDGRIENVATIFITNKEYPFRCLMCDLWKNTTTHRVPNGVVPAQIEWALQQMPAAGGLKLYNSGNFFDGQAIPQLDWPRIAELVRPNHTVIVESHPKLVDRRCLDFAALIDGRLEVAMGLETVAPQVLARLNKRMTLEDYRSATKFLISHGVNVRAFILIRTPFQSEQEGVEWAKRSLDWAFSIGVECCAMIPTRVGNGAMEWLHERGLFSQPSLESVETVLEYGIGLNAGRVFADLWDIARVCPDAAGDRARIERLRRMNLEQTILPARAAEARP